MELGTTLTIEIALAIGVISVIIFQMSTGLHNGERQKLSAGIIIGIYIFLFQVMIIFIFPYLIEVYFDPELTIIERIFSPNRILDISTTAAEKFIKDRLINAVTLLIMLLLSVAEKWKSWIPASDVKTPILAALNVVGWEGVLYCVSSRYLYTIQSETWLHVIYSVLNIVIVLLTSSYIDKQIKESNKNYNKSADGHTIE